MKKQILAAAVMATCVASALAADDWSGFYIGANLASTKQENNFVVPLYPSSGGFDSTKATLGVHAGYNWLFSNNILLGIHAEYQDLTNSGSALSGGDGGELYHSKAKDQTFIGARLGYNMGQFLPYLKAGDARVKMSEANFIPDYGMPRSGTYSGTLYGIGVDYKVNKNWFLGLEYSEVDLGSKRFEYGGPVDLALKNKALTFRASYLFN